MAKFTDALNREWEIELFDPDIKKLREIGLDLNKLQTDSEVLNVFKDMEKLGDVMSYLCSERIGKLGLTAEQFARGFNGPTRFDAMQAFLVAWVNFSQSPGVAKRLALELPGLMDQQEKKAIEQLEKALSGSKISAANSAELSGSSPAG